jgi:hypothetical protein
MYPQEFHALELFKYDLITLLVLLAHRASLKTKGFWRADDTEGRLLIHLCDYFHRRLRFSGGVPAIAPTDGLETTGVDGTTRSDDGDDDNDNSSCIDASNPMLEAVKVNKANSLEDGASFGEDGEVGEGEGVVTKLKASLVQSIVQYFQRLMPPVPLTWDTEHDECARNVELGRAQEHAQIEHVCLNTIHLTNAKPGHDYYGLICSVQFISLLYCVFGFSFIIFDSSQGNCTHLVRIHLSLVTTSH